MDYFCMSLCKGIRMKHILVKYWKTACWKEGGEWGGGRINFHLKPSITVYQRTPDIEISEA